MSDTSSVPQKKIRHGRLADRYRLDAVLARQADVLVAVDGLQCLESTQVTIIDFAVK
jgi:hypothetical protein